VPIDDARAGGEVSAGVSLIDTHCHLNHPRLLRGLPDVLARARAAGVAAAIVVGYDLPSSRKAVELAEGHSDIWAAVGVHPHDAAEVGQDDLSEIRALARSERVVAIGETGLDFYRNLSPRPAQEKAFSEHLALAAELGLPAIVHCREAQEEVLAALESDMPPSPVIWHCFAGTLDQARRALDLGLFLGFGGRVTYRSADELRSVAAHISADSILLETDCPYLAPEPKRGRDNEPANLVAIAEAMAAIRGDEGEAFMATTSENALRVFGLNRARP